MKIEKQELVKSPLSKESLKLAQSLYSTYIQSDKESLMSIPCSKLYHLFGLSDTPFSSSKLLEIFDDLNEPMMVHDFIYKGKKYPEIVLTFCEYEKVYKDGMNYLLIQLNEMYLEAMKNYMLHPFLEIKH